MPFAEDVFRLYEQGVLRGWSIGFVPRQGVAAAGRRRAGSRSGTCSNTRPCRSPRTRSADGGRPQGAGERPRPGPLARPRRRAGAARAVSFVTLRVAANHLHPRFARFHHVRIDSSDDVDRPLPDPRRAGGVHRSPDRHAVEKALPAGRAAGAVGRHGPVGQDSAGYSVLKAAAFALGYVGPDQAKEEIHAHHQLRDLYAGYGFMPHRGQQSFLVPLASAHLPAFEPQGPRLRDEVRQKMTAQANRFDPDEADWIAPPRRRPHEGARHARRHGRRQPRPLADARRADRPAAEPRSVRRRPGRRRSPCRRTAASSSRS